MMTSSNTHLVGIRECCYLHLKFLCLIMKTANALQTILVFSLFNCIEVCQKDRKKIVEKLSNIKQLKVFFCFVLFEIGISKQEEYFFILSSRLPFKI